MKNRATILIAFVLLASCGVLRAGEVRKTPGDSSWVSGLRPDFEKRAKNAGLENLATSKSPGRGDFEVRVWSFYVFYQEECEGYVLKKTGARWDAKWLPGAPLPGKTMRQWQAIGLKPKRPWDQIWNDLQKNAVFTLPDDARLKLPPVPLGGICYIVEVRDSRRYRAYSYDNPISNNLKGPVPEQIKMMNIVGVFDDSFDMPYNFLGWRTL